LSRGGSEGHVWGYPLTTGVSHPLDDAAGTTGGPYDDRSDVARTSIELDVPVDQVWDLLSDGWLFASWVVGTIKIRDVDDTWPAAGSRLAHTVGAWPLGIADQTEVLACEPNRRLVLRARGWPAGEATVEIVLEALDRERTKVELVEEPTAGPGAWVQNRWVDAVGRRRLDEMLARLGGVVQGRYRARVPQTD
jgi:uncharacterized protein YndB with AHSA1/START domain